jgi:DNA polymerase-3 subunit delta
VSKATSAPQTPAPVYALIGADAYLQTERLSQILSTMPPDVQRVDVDGEKAELAEVLDELRSFAMFGGAKLVVVRNADTFITRFREQLENYLESPSNSGTLVLRVTSLPSNQRIYKMIAKVGVAEKCEPPKAADLPRWITMHAKSAHGVTIAPQAAELLAEMIGDDLGRLDNELAKLALQIDGGKIDVPDVRAGVSFQREQEMYDMTNEIAAGNADEALRRWRQLVQMDRSAEFRAVTWLAMWLEKAQQAVQMRKKGMNAFSIASALKIWPRELQERFIRTAERMGEAGVARAIDLLVEVDHQSKTGVGDAAENVERFLLTIAGAQKQTAAH